MATGEGIQSSKLDVDNVSQTPSASLPANSCKKTKVMAGTKPADKNRVGLKSLTPAVCHEAMTTGADTESGNLPDSQHGSSEASRPLTQESVMGGSGGRDHSGLDCHQSATSNIGTMRHHTRKELGMASDSREA